ncbi:MAG TPA: replicative DNA helicase, partial [Candidatus Limnocylindrales bacterium]|nr:replicative DNA helicase [Candidatus Limnocylindrales bacterium]
TRRMEASPTFAQAVFDRTPPFSMEAETAVLGGVLIDRDALVRAIEVVDETMFYREGNRRLFRAMVKLFERGDVIDVITVSEELKKTAEFDAAGGYDYLAGLINAVPTAANVEYHARIVADKALLRRLVEQATHIIRDVYEQGDREVEELLDEAETRIFKVAESHDREGFARIKDLLFSAIERIDARQESGGGLTGIPTGFPRLDDLTSGFQKGDLCIVAARPSMGKTSWVLNVMGNAAVHHNKAVAFFSLEMSREQLVERLLCSEGRIDLQKLRHRRLEFEENKRLAQAAGYLHNAHIWIDDSPAVNVLEVRAKARRLQAELRREGDELALVGIDYLQLMSGHRHTDNRVQEVSDISRGLKALARELDVPVIALSQLSRATEQRPDRRPMLSDLRDSGAIEQDADVVMFLHRQDYYLTQQGKYDEANQVEGHTDLTVAKQRNGPTGSVPLLFRKAWTRFEPRDESKLARSLEAEAGSSGLLP